MTRSIRAAAGAAIVAVIAALAVVLPVSTAHAATTYTWNQGWDGNGDPIPGSDHMNWSNPKNWSPEGVPVSGDSVILSNAPNQSATTLTVPAGMSLASFTMSDPGSGNVYLQGAPLTVTGSFDWTGGYIGIPVTIAGAGRVGAGNPKYLASLSSGIGMLKVTGTLNLDNIGGGENGRLSTAADYDGDSDGIRIMAGAVLRATGNNLVRGAGCCTDPAKIVVDGAIDVSGGTTTFSDVELSLRGTAKVVSGATLAATGGPARLGANARYTGGGTVDFTDTAAIRAYPDREPVPGGILMEGTGFLDAGTRIHFGRGAKLTGRGGFTGKGVVDISAAVNPARDGAHIYADLTIGAASKLQIGGATPSGLESWSPDLPGYHGVLRIDGTAELTRASSFRTQSGTVATIAKGATLRLAPGSTWGEGSCCVDPARLANAGALEISGGSGAAARIVRVDLRTTGTVALAAGKRLSTEGYPVRLGGTLQVAERAKPGRPRTVVTAQQVIGRFHCVRPTGQVATYTPTQVRVTGVLGKVGACAASVAGKKLAAKKVGKHKKMKIKAVKGVPKKAKKVLLAITVAKPAKAAKIKVSGAPAFKAAKGKKTTRYVAAKRTKKNFVTVRNGGKKPVKIKVVLLGAA